MSNTLSNRADCMGEIRRAIADDAWCARYVLFEALKRLDLGALNEVLDATYAAENDPQWPHNNHLQLLLQERWG